MLMMTLPTISMKNKQVIFIIAPRQQLIGIIYFSYKMDLTERLDLILTGFKINDFITAQLDCTVFLADWHTYINNKLGGDWDKIKRISNYYSEAFKFFCPGVHIKVGSEL